MRVRNVSLALTALLLIQGSALASPSLLIMKNQFGEQSSNTITGPTLPLAGSANVVVMTGATAPVNSTTGAGIAAKGSLYIAQDTGVLYQNTNNKTSPTWANASGSALAATLSGFSAAAGTVSSADTVLVAFNKLVGNTQNLTVIGNVLTAYSAGAGTVTSSDSVLGAFQKLGGNTTQLKNGTFTPAPETVSGAGAISTTLMETIVANGTGGSYAATLAAPSSQDGQIKIIKMTTATHTVTVACTNIVFSGAYTPTGTTTLTFTSTGDSAVLMALGAKWIYLGGSAVAS